MERRDIRFNVECPICGWHGYVNAEELELYRWNAYLVCPNTAEHNLRLQPKRATDSAFGCLEEKGK